MNIRESQRFIRCLGIVSILWLGFGLVVTHSDPEAMSAFLRVYFYTCLDLLFLLLLFWKLFFTPSAQRGRSLQLLFFLTFKLVCLGLLAITLKRLRNAPMTGIITGIIFIWIGPLLAGITSRILSRKEETNPQKGP